MDVTDAAMIAGISAAISVLKKVRKRREKYQRSIWMKDYFKTRNFGIMRELELNETLLFKNFTRMSRTNFYMLLGMVEPKIEKKYSFQRIPAEVKLMITLRYLATGDSFMSLMYLFKASKQFISSMLPGVLKAIIEGLQDYVKVKTFIIIIN
jgi:hypothetical protein